jgi:hypothetical protein
MIFYVTRRVAGKWAAGVPVHDDHWKIAARPPVVGPAIAAKSGRRVFGVVYQPPTARVTWFSDDAAYILGAPTQVDGGSPVAGEGSVVATDGGTS